MYVLMTLLKAQSLLWWWLQYRHVIIMRYFRKQHNFQRISCNFHHAHINAQVFYGEDGQGVIVKIQTWTGGKSVRVQRTSAAYECSAESSLPNCYAHARSSASWRAPSRGKIINKTKPSTIKKIRGYPSFLDQLKPTKIVLTWIFMTSQFFEVTRLTWTGCNVFYRHTKE